LPITGQIDVSSILTQLGDPDHGLRAGAIVNTEEQQEEYIYRATRGPVDISTSVSLEPAWDLIWDVNGYYRALGFEWPYRPTKKELRLAYDRLNGQDNSYLTYVFKQLLNREIRKKYDRMPYGTTFRDRYVIEEEAKEMAKIAQEMSEEEGRIVTVDELVEEVDRARAKKKKELEAETNKFLLSAWQWGYFLWRSRKNEYVDLIDWQRYLIKAFADRGVERIISIGYIGSTEEPYVIKTWNGKTIIFLNENQSPSLTLAETAVSEIVRP
jgi:hypothetical protein